MLGSFSLYLQLEEYIKYSTSFIFKFILLYYVCRYVELVRCSVGCL